MIELGVKFVDTSSITEVVRESRSSQALVRWTQKEDGSKNEETYEEVMWAIGRKPSVQNLALEKAGVTLDDNGYIAVDSYQVGNFFFDGLYHYQV